MDFQNLPQYIVNQFIHLRVHVKHVYRHICNPLKLSFQFNESLETEKNLNSMQMMFENFLPDELNLLQRSLQTSQEQSLKFFSDWKIKLQINCSQKIKWVYSPNKFHILRKYPIQSFK